MTNAYKIISIFLAVGFIFGLYIGPSIGYKIAIENFNRSQQPTEEYIKMVKDADQRIIERMFR